MPKPGTYEYNKSYVENYMKDKKQIHFTALKTRMEEYYKLAEKRGVSLNKLITGLLEAELEREEKGESWSES